MSMDWVLVKHSLTLKPIGAIGFLDNKIAVVSAFYEDKDADKDGKIGLGERISSAIFSMKGKAIAEVASQAYANPDILMRDSSLYNLRGKLLVEFASGLVNDGIYTVYFNQAVGKLAGLAAAGLTAEPIKQFVIKKGMESTVKEAYRDSVHSS